MLRTWLAWRSRFEAETLWLTQAQIAELFQTSVRNISLHIKAIYDEGELAEAATIKSYLMVRPEGARQVSREVLHYSRSQPSAGCASFAGRRPGRRGA